MERVRLRVRQGGHQVPQEDIRRRFTRSVRHFPDDCLPLADEWGVWENFSPPARQIATGETCATAELKALLQPETIMELNKRQHEGISEMSRMVLEASRAATEKILDYYKRMGIRVTPRMTLAPDPEPKPKRRRRSEKD